ncbi:MAG: metal-dependent phosphohydrolase [bacterium]|nr:metal-dependent phosphohydrolase [bacterium]
MTGSQRAEFPDLNRAIAGLVAPDTSLVREATRLAWESSSPLLFNHVMRCYYLGRLTAGRTAGGYDDEIVFLSAVLHDLGLTAHAPGPRRFEIEGADAAQRFLDGAGCDKARGWLVWDTIALHPLDINLHKEPEARVVQAGILADVIGVGVGSIEPSLVDEVVRAFPRSGFKKNFFELLLREAGSKPHAHVMHPTYMVAHHCCGGVPIPDARAMIEAAPFEE